MERRGLGECFWAYLTKKRWELILFAVFFLSIFLIYGLYGLPWGPAVYVSLVTGTLGAVCLFRGFLHYRIKIKELDLLVKQAAQHLGEMTDAWDLSEKLYQKVAGILESRCEAAEEGFRRSARDATRYYTLWSHQIKTPLAAMRLLLQEESVDRGAMEQELFKTEQYVEMVLGYQRLGGDTQDLVLQEYDVENLVRQAVKKVSTLFIRKKIGIQLGELSYRVVTDEKWLVFILEQLLTNAVKYTPEGGRVSVYLSEKTPGLLVVEDSGIGIREEDLPRVFDWGYTGYNGRREQRSTGIGLTLCRQAASLLGHTLGITSKVGQGTRVMLGLSRKKLELE